MCNTLYQLCSLLSGFKNSAKTALSDGSKSAPELRRPPAAFVNRSLFSTTTATTTMQWPAPALSTHRKAPAATKRLQQVTDELEETKAKLEQITGEKERICEQLEETSRKLDETKALLKAANETIARLTSSANEHSESSNTQ